MNVLVVSHWSKIIASMTFHLPVDRRKGDVPLQRRKGVYAPKGQELCLQEKRMSISVSSTGMESNLAPRGHPQQGRTAQHFFWLAPKPFCSQRACSKALGHIGRKQAGRSPKIESMPSPTTLLAQPTVPFWNAHSGSPEIMQVERSFSFHFAMVTSSSITPIFFNPLNIPLPLFPLLSSCGDWKKRASNYANSKCVGW